jgi:nicotinate phosphoribosyltransferase
LAAGPNKDLLEFGLRRAQGPDGALSASKYCYIGGFDGTSNVLAGKLYGIPIRGTHAHSYVSSFYDYNELKISTCKSLITNEIVDLGIIACELLKELEKKDLNFLEHECNKGELGAFVSFAIAFPSRFLALVDTYNVLKSGVPNFCAVALALHKIGYKASGIRLDSGDLAYLSLECRNFFKKVATEFNVDYFESLTIVASNDINEDVLHSLKNQGNSIDTFGIGTHLVTCQKQPALGCVFKLVEVNHKPCIKLSEEFQKVTFPGKKNAYRLYDKDGCPLVDLLTKSEEPAPVVGEAFLCRHPFIETKRAYLTPSKVKNLLIPMWENGGLVEENLDSIKQVKERVAKQLLTLRNDHKRMLNPTPYKITVSKQLYEFMHQLWLDYTPIGELF